jgi:hypothetical protein
MIARTRVYLAACSTDRGRAAFIAKELEASGLVELPHPWWDMPGIGHDAFLTEREQAAVSQLCIEKLETCSVLWWLFPTFARHTSSAIEFGYALALSKLRGLEVMSSGSAVATVALTAGPARFRDDVSAFLYLMDKVRGPFAGQCEVP